MWDTTTWTPIGEPWRLGDEYVDDGVVEVSRDGRVLASPVSNNEVRVWNVDDRTPVGSPLTFPGGVQKVALDANGNTLVVAENGVLHVLDPATGAARGPQPTFATSTITALEMNRDATMLAVGNIDGQTQLFDLTTGEALGPPLAATAGLITDVSFSADGSRLATAGLDRTGALWRLDGGRSIGVARAQHDAPVTEVHYTPDGRSLVTAGVDGSVVVADASTGKEQRRVDVDGEVRTVAVDAPGKRLAVGGTDGTVRIFELATGRLTAQRAVGDGLVHQVAIQSRHGRACDLHRGSGCGRGLHGPRDRVGSGDRSRRRQPDRPARPHVRVLDRVGARRHCARRRDRRHARAFLRWQPRASRGGCADRKRRQSRPRPRVLARRSPPGHRVRLRPSVVDRRPHSRRRGAEGPERRDRGVAYSPDGALLAATTIGLGTTRMWDARTGAPIGADLTAGRTPFTDRTFLIDHFIGARPSFSPDGAHLATPSFDGTTVIWDLSAQRWFAEACDLAGRNLTRAEWRQHLGTRTYRETCAAD